MAIEEHDITCIADFIERLNTLTPRAKSIWFRGHARANWKLEPTLSRKNKLAEELKVTKRFKQNAFQFLTHVPQQEWEWMFLMQHLTLPSERVAHKRTGLDFRPGCG